eukprot:2163701-Rhodomonas_salina.3
MAETSSALRRGRITVAERTREDLVCSRRVSCPWVRQLCDMHLILGQVDLDSRVAQTPVVFIQIMISAHYQRLIEPDIAAWHLRPGRRSSLDPASKVMLQLLAHSHASKKKKRFELKHTDSEWTLRKHVGGELSENPFGSSVDASVGTWSLAMVD